MLKNFKKLDDNRFLAEKDVVITKDDLREIVVAREGQEVDRAVLVRHGLLEEELEPETPQPAKTEPAKAAAPMANKAEAPKANKSKKVK